MTELFTGRYRTFEASMGVPVSITVGQPKWPLGYEIRHRIHRIAPWGLMKLDGERFVAAYRERLDRLDVAALAERFEAISAAEGGRPPVLLCFEDVHAGQLCHRRVFAEYWHERTGQAVPEIPAKTTNPAFWPWDQLSFDVQSTAPEGAEGST
jgi:hypothetical protein